ncbi:hypothetical protein NPS53_07390 [Pseudomonas putida]|uniref:hypothetical protein n=1 Tax=Pseudomonas putida TaxID=303 RepID=UPI0023644CF3|nr:hypothetical protein [Pseudomonas putida]MDD2139393.1 hypothetical protein [Pseudomonas putida]HDS1723407.1 hypothetical protein [Pseudomonas putida]
MSEQRLLELAAKAAGMAPPYDEHGVFSAWVGDPVHGHWWDPLNDDGDALRLALCRPGLDLTWVITEAWQAADDVAERAAYVRRAITETLARIGQAMKEKR